MKNALLDIENLNVLIVAWGDGAKFPDYSQAASNIRTVARELNLIVKGIRSIFKPSRLLIHCIGHSLGAQMCGLAGSESEIRFERISALDPAGPFFENTDPIVCVDSSDAKFVDVIHTNGGTLLESKFGLRAPVGHMDFFVNGGEFQPGCPTLFQIILQCIGNINKCKGGELN